MINCHYYGKIIKNISITIQMKVEKRDIATFDEKCKAIKTALTPEFYSVLVKYSINRSATGKTC